MEVNVLCIIDELNSILIFHIFLKYTYTTFLYDV